jgi:hypothetical protein
MDNETTFDRAALLKKIHALMEKTVENGATLNEAALAAAKVQELLQKYDLSLSEVKNLPDDDPFVSEHIFLKDENGNSKYRKETWFLELGLAVGEAYFCETLISRWLVNFIGRKSDVEIAKYTFEMLVNSLRAAAQHARVEYVRAKWGRDTQPVSTMHGSEHPGLWYQSWFDGAVLEIRRTLREQAQKFAASSAKGSALIVLKSEQAEEYARERYPRAYRERKRSILDDESSNWNEAAYRNGKEVGRSMTIKAGVGSGAKRDALPG